MNRKLAVFLLFIILAPSLFADETKDDTLSYTILVSEKHNNNILGVAPRYYTFNLYNEIIHQMGLLNRIALEDKIKIIKTISPNLSYETPVKLTVHNYKDGKDLQLSFRLHKDEDDTKGLFMATNINRDNNSIITSKEEVTSAYAKFFVVKNNLLLSPENLYTESSLEDLANDSIARARYYVLDEKKENDETAETILESIISSENTVSNKKLNAHINLGLLYYLQQKPDKTESFLDTAVPVIKELRENDEINEILLYNIKLLFEIHTINEKLKQHIAFR